MHEFLLFSHIPAARHRQVLNILAGVTGAPPEEVQEQVVVVQPLKAQHVTVAKKTGAGKPQPTSQPLYFHSLVRSVEAEGAVGNASAGWRLVVPEMPEAGVKNLIVRGISERRLAQDDLEGFKDASSFALANGFMTTAHRFIHNNIVIRIFRVLKPAIDFTLASLDSTPPHIGGCSVVDPSGSFVMEACIRVEDRSQSGISDRVTDELMAFKNMMDGSLDLRVVDRLSLDTRVKTL